MLTFKLSSPFTCCWDRWGQLVIIQVHCTQLSESHIDTSTLTSFNQISAFLCKCHQNLSKSLRKHHNSVNPRHMRRSEEILVPSHYYIFKPFTGVYLLHYFCICSSLSSIFYVGAGPNWYWISSSSSKILNLRTISYLFGVQFNHVDFLFTSIFF